MVSKQLNRIDKKIADLEPGSVRHQALSALRQFRASWVELGRLLNQVAFDGDYKEWGYDEFEEYCAKELGLKKPTVQKLMVSYNYMKTHEADRLHAFEDDPHGAQAPIPDYQTVGLLQQIRKKADTGEIEEKEAERLHERAFAGEEEETTLRKEIRESLRPERAPAPANNGAGLGVLQRMGRALRIKLAAAEDVPGQLKDRLESALLELEELQA